MTERYIDIAKSLANEYNQAQSGTPFPTDEEIAKKYNVNRMTAREAVEYLMKKLHWGLKRGSGYRTEIKRPGVQVGEIFMSLEEAIKRTGKKPTTRLIRSYSITAETLDPEMKKALGLTYQDQQLSALDELILADEKPVRVETIFVPPKLNNLLKEDEGKASLLSRICNFFGENPEKALVHLQKTTQNEGKASLLGVGAKD